MFEPDDRIYYENRIMQATELGDRATDPQIAALHYELALRYAILSVQGNQTKLDIVGFSRRRTCSTPEPVRVLLLGGAEPELEMASRQA